MLVKEYFKSRDFQENKFWQRYEKFISVFFMDIAKMTIGKPRKILDMLIEIKYHICFSILMVFESVYFQTEIYKNKSQFEKHK